MPLAADSRTSPTLLGRLSRQPVDQAAWGEFVERYGRRIYHWCRRWDLQDADAQDVTQDVLLKLARKLRTFRYDASGSFRAWLKTVVRHSWSDFVTRSSVRGPGGRAWPADFLQAGDDLVEELNDVFDRELLDEAMARVRLCVEAHTWEAFRLTALEGLSGAETARRLGIKVATVFVAAGRVRRRLQDELGRLGLDPRPVTENHTP
jgi:RNA polymerase sigma-70 factor (ECF subfamily)